MSPPQILDKPLLRALAGESLPIPPVWLMRQAGRYLPEYRKARSEVQDFLELCFTPELAVEVTLQPIRRFELDAAILFSDILVVPHALGQEVRFEEGSGPRLAALSGPGDLERLEPDALRERLEPVFETLRRLRSLVPPGTALIGFAGAPWTVASYMLEGGSSRDFLRAKGWAYGRREDFARLIALLVEATSDYLIAQLEAGAEVLQIFDSWAGVWPEREFRRWCMEPVAEIVRRVKARFPAAPLILFPRGAGPLYAEMAGTGGAEGLSLDQSLPLSWAAAELKGRATLQGNLDPAVLLAGGTALDRAVADILEALADGPFIFNLGHGIDKATPLAHVERLLSLVRR